MKKYSFLLIIGIIVWIVFVIIFVLPWITLALGLYISPNPPEPTIKYGEFPFEIIYEINGESYTVNDIFVCKYEGIAIDEGSGKHRTWSGYLKSTGKHGVILLEDEKRTIYCYVGDEEIYMDDQDNCEKEPLVPYVYCTIKTKNYEDRLSEKEILEEYNIKLVGWTLSDPIENSFE